MHQIVPLFFDNREIPKSQLGTVRNTMDNAPFYTLLHLNSRLLFVLGFGHVKMHLNHTSHVL